jgi:DNA mismatch repair protein MLH3
VNDFPQSISRSSHPFHRDFPTLFSRDDRLSAEHDQNSGIDRSLVRSDLQRACVVGQVDRKFISCILETGNSNAIGPLLMLIDQHAADERVRVEHLLQDLCIGYLLNKHSVHSALEDVTANHIGIRTLHPAIQIVLTAHEVSEISGSPAIRSAFADWGFYFDLPAKPQMEVGGDATYSQVAVTRIPETVSDKVWANFRRSCCLDLGIENRSFLSYRFGAATTRRYATGTGPRVNHPIQDGGYCAASPEGG